MGTLYIVPTPIGNLEDITLRALRILREVRLIAAEDTRTTRVLLDHYEIDTRLTSYHEHNKLSKLESIFEQLEYGDVALVSDAGTPGISDPGYELINAMLAEGIPVVPLPGANAVITAMVASGLPSDAFVYLGFLPKREKSRRDLFEELADERRTLIAYDNPYRLAESLQIAFEVLGDRPVCVAREMTKLFEEFNRTTLAYAVDYYADEPPKGEITLVIGGAVGDLGQWDEDRVRRALAERMEQGEKLSRAAKSIAKKCGWNKRDVYALGTDLQKQ